MHSICEFDDTCNCTALSVKFRSGLYRHVVGLEI